MLYVRVAGVGASVPKTHVRNAEIEARLGLEAGWIERRTGILSRPVAGKTIATSDLAIEAGAQALQAAGMSRSDVGLLLLATSTPDHLLPPTGPLVAHRLALTNAGAIDLAGACSGFLYALAMGSCYAQSMQKPVLVIAANILSRRVNPDDAATVALFGDGAGAVVLVPSPEAHILSVYLSADGEKYGSICIPAGGTRDPLTADGLRAGRHLMVMAKGAALFKDAVEKMAEAGQQAMREADIRPDEVEWWIPHQANIRLMREAGKLLGIPMGRTISIIDGYANSSAATIPIALADAVAVGTIKTGDRILLTAAGAGMLYSGLMLRWS